MRRIVLDRPGLRRPQERSRADGSINNWTPGDSLHADDEVSREGTRWEWGSSQPIADLHGLTLEQLHAARTPVTFTLERDAGTFAFEGTVTLGVGSGDYRFVADPTFKAKLGALGYDVASEDDVSIMMMAVRDISSRLRWAGSEAVGIARRGRPRSSCVFADHGAWISSSIRDLTMHRLQLT